MKLSILFVLVAMVALTACGAPECAKGQVRASAGGACAAPKSVCPPGTTEESGGSASNDCQGKAGLSLKDEGGNISGQCVSKGDTTVKCTPIACGTAGVKEINANGVVCK